MSDTADHGFADIAYGLDKKVVRAPDAHRVRTEAYLWEMNPRMRMSKHKQVFN